MDCRTAESMVQKYINKTLTLEELDAFITHVKKCPDCYEELETYFTVSAAIHHLDGGMDSEFDSTMNMNHLLEMDLKQRESAVRHGKIRKKLAFFIGFAAICVLMVLVFWIFL